MSPSWVPWVWILTNTHSGRPCTWIPVRIQSSTRCADGGHFVLFGSNYQDVFAFLMLILVLVFRPSGLLGERVSERA